MEEGTNSFWFARPPDARMAKFDKTKTMNVQARSTGRQRVDEEILKAHASGLQYAREQIAIQTPPAKFRQGASTP